MSNDGEELTAEEIEELRKQGKVITVKHEGLPTNKGKDPEKEALKEKVKERDSQLALIALREFEVERDKLIESARPDLTEDQLEKLKERLDEPDKLEGAKVWVNILSQAKEYGKPPSGRATLGEGNPHGSAISRAKNVIDELYEVLQDPTKSQSEKAEADRRLDSLFSELIRGVSLSQRRGKFPRFSKTTCPQCGSLIEGRATSCPECGWVQLVPRQTRRSS